MCTATQLLARAEAFDPEKTAVEALQQSEEVMANLNAEQINTGLKADGTEMPDYSFRSVFQYGKPPGPIRLRDTGNWQAGLYVKATSSGVEYGSTDSKDQILTGRYGDLIHGLSDKFAQEAIIEKIEPEFMKATREKLNL